MVREKNLPIMDSSLVCGVAFLRAGLLDNDSQAFEAEVFQDILRFQESRFHFRLTDSRSSA